MEMDRIPAKFKCLAEIKELSVQDTANTGFILWIMDHNMGSIKILCRCLRIALVFDSPCEQPNFRSHLDEIRANTINDDFRRKVLINKFPIKGEHSSLQNKTGVTRMDSNRCDKCSL